MKEQPEKLHIKTDEEIKKDLGFDKEIKLEVAGEIMEKKADDFIDQLLDETIEAYDKRKAVDEMGADTQNHIAHLSKMLDTPIKSMAKSGETGGPVANSLLDLKETVEDLDPASFDFKSPSGFMESLGKFIPFIGKRISRYFTKFMTAEEVIDRIIQSLEKGRDQLKRDNITLSTDKDRLQESSEKLVRIIQLGKILDQKLQYKLDNEIPSDDPKYNFIQNELLFPLRQRIIDLQQTLNISQQGILTVEIIIRNNRELIRGVSRALNVTVSALQVAVATALALNNQEIVLKKINALNDTTSEMIAQNAERLKTQGADIHKKSTESMINIEVLEKSFQDIKLAIDDINQFRQAALPRMADHIQRMDSLNTEALKTVKEIRKGDDAQSSLSLELND